MTPFSRPFLLGVALLLSASSTLAAPNAPLATTPAGAADANHPALADYPVSKAPYLAAYHWGAANPGGGSKANEAFARWINRPVVWGEDFEAIDAWENNIEGGSWQLGEWQTWKKQNPARRLILSVPLLPGGWNRGGPARGEGAGQPVSLEAGARGDYNAHFKVLAEQLVNYGLSDSVLRLGWEFNGGWYTWRASDNPKAWADYWKQIVTTMRAVKGAEKLQFCWNPALGWQQFPSEQAYPGDDTVDIIGLDVYDDSWASDTYPLPSDVTPEDAQKRRDKAWNEVIYGGNMGLKSWSDFAKAHKKLFAIPEWGVSKREDGHGGLDNPVFVEQMHQFISDPDNNVYFHCYFDVQAGDGHHQLSTGIADDETSEFPKASARFRELFAQSDAAIPGKGTGLSLTYFGDKLLKKTVGLGHLSTLDFGWGGQRPTTGIPATTLGVRFVGQVQALEGGTYSFQTPTNGQCRLWVNNRLIIDSTKGVKSGIIALVAGQRYAIKGEIVGTTGGTKAKLQWKRPGHATFETVPPTQLLPALDEGTGLQGNYFDGANFEKLVAARTDAKVDFWWGKNSPNNADGTPMKDMGADNFSVRWTGQVQALEGGTYTFSTNTDDGVRLWVDGKLLVDHWVGQALTSYSGTIELMPRRKYAMKMEYFDGTADAIAKLSWTRPGHTDAQLIPPNQLFPTP